MLAGNGNGGIVDETDYTLWKSNFGMTSSGTGPQFIAGKVVYSPLVTPGVGSLHAVPEPATAILIVCGLVMVGSVTCRRR